MGYLRLRFLLLGVIDSGESIFYNLISNNSAKILNISKSLLGMSIETRISRLVKKTGVKKSRWTVPLTLLFYIYIYMYIYIYSIYIYTVSIIPLFFPHQAVLL